TDKPTTPKGSSTTIVGEISHIENAKQSFRLKISEVDPAALQRIAQHQAELTRARNAQEVANAQRAIAQAQAQMYHLVDLKQGIDATEDCKFRMENPPLQFDDKGKPKKPTQKELKELKGDDKQPGYPATFADLKIGQVVKITLVKPKDAVKPAKDKKEGEGVAENYQASMVMIVREPPPPK